MKTTKIDFSRSFDSALATVLSLPKTRNGKTDGTLVGKQVLTQSLRRLYHAANGRQVQTSVGPIAIAPAVAPWLKEAPFEICTQEDFLRLAAQFRDNGSADVAGAGEQISASTTTNLPIHITAHHLNLDHNLRRFVFKKIGPLRRFANHALTAEIILRRDGRSAFGFSATGRLSLPGRDINSRATGSDIYSAIQKLVAKLARLCRKRKTQMCKVFSRARKRQRDRGQQTRVFGLERTKPGTLHVAFSL
jgi:ribosomal subunit interface protein